MLQRENRQKNEAVKHSQQEQKVFRWAQSFLLLSVSFRFELLFLTLLRVCYSPHQSSILQWRRHRWMGVHLQLVSKTCSMHFLITLNVIQLACTAFLEINETLTGVILLFLDYVGRTILKSMKTSFLQRRNVLSCHLQKVPNLPIFLIFVLTEVK